MKRILKAISTILEEKLWPKNQKKINEILGNQVINCQFKKLKKKMHYLIHV